MPHNEMPLELFIAYLEQKHVSHNDRVIINGGEPLLHTEFMRLLASLKKYNCEVLIYTNGRLLSNIDLTLLDSNFRFIVPVHGDKTLHDSITGIKGSYDETLLGMNSFNTSVQCKLDLKVILHNRMIENEERFKIILESYSNVYFNNAVHLTKMADTLVSKNNNCVSMTNEATSHYMKIMFEYFAKKNFIIKIFDTCVKDFDWVKSYTFEKFHDNIEVYFKDYNQGRQIILEKPKLDCSKDCSMREYCMSAVGEYTVLEFNKNKLYENLE